MPMRTILLRWLLSVSLLLLLYSSVAHAEESREEIDRYARTVRRRPESVKRLMSADTDRGGELRAWLDRGKVLALEADLGLSSKDLIFFVLFRHGVITRIEVSERTYFANEDGDRQFDRPKRTDRRSNLLFRKGQLLAEECEPSLGLGVTEANRAQKQKALEAFVTALRNVLASDKEAPDFDARMLLTAIFDKS